MTSCSLLLLLLAVAFTSCLSNEIHFDLKTQEIRSCNSKGLRYVWIEKDSTAEITFTFEWTQEASAPTTISLSSVDPGYFVTDERDYRIDNKAVKLAPLTMYRVFRSGGDAGSYGIDIWTDKDGKVVKVSPETCH